MRRKIPTYCDIAFWFMFFAIFRSIAIPIIVPQPDDSNPQSSYYEHLIKDATKYPFLARLLLNTSKLLQCGVTIISKNTVMTAAHCIYDRDLETFMDPSLFQVAAGCVGPVYDPIFTKDGMIDTGNISGCQFVTVRRFRNHLSFNSSNFMQNDFAILELNSYLKMSPTVAIAKLPKPGSVLNGVGTLLGFGCNSTRPCFNNELVRVQVDIARGEPCKNIWPKMMDKGQFCTISKSAGACEGDSGSPLLCLDEDGTEVVCAIMSFGFDDCTNTVGNIYTDVVEYLHIINHKGAHSWASWKQILIYLGLMENLFAILVFIYDAYLQLKGRAIQKGFGLRRALFGFTFLIGFGVGYLLSLSDSG